MCCCCSPPLQAAAEVSSDTAARLSELSSTLSAKAAELAKLRASCAGLQKKVAALQVRRLQHCLAATPFPGSTAAATGHSQAAGSEGDWPAPHPSRHRGVALLMCMSCFADITLLLMLMLAGQD